MKERSARFSPPPFAPRSFSAPRCASAALRRGRSVERRVKRSPHKHPGDQGDESGRVAPTTRGEDEAVEKVKKVITEGRLQRK